MKKKTLTGLSLNKEVIAKFDLNEIKGGVDKRKITNPCPSNVGVGICATNHERCNQQ